MITADKMRKKKGSEEEKYKNKFSMWLEYESTSLYADALKSSAKK